LIPDGDAMWIIDRFEGDMAVVEADNIYFNVPRAALPEGTAEGDCIGVIIDTAATSKRRAEMEQLMKKLFENG